MKTYLILHGILALWGLLDCTTRLAWVRWLKAEKLLPKDFPQVPSPLEWALAVAIPPAYALLRAVVMRRARR